jgi:hypothetical protein
VNNQWLVMWALNTVSGNYVKNGFGGRAAIPQNLPSAAVLAARP